MKRTFMHRGAAEPTGRMAWRLCASVAAASLIVVAGCGHKEAGEQAKVAPGPVGVEVVKVRRAMTPLTREWLSSLDGTENVQIQARVQGYLDKQNYANGSVVKAGDVLFEIDPRPFKAALDQAEATLATEQARQIETQLTENRDVQLFASKTISAAERDQSVQANAAAKARVLAARAAVVQADLNLTYTKVRAPIDGIAGIALPGIGDLVGPGTGILTSISKVDPIKAVIQLSEQEYLASADKINAAASAAATTSTQQADGVELQLVLGDGNVHPHKGRITAVNRQFDVRTGTVQADAQFPNPRNKLRPGFFAKVRMLIHVKEGLLLIPQRCVSDVQGVHMVAVVGSDNKVSIRRVKLYETLGSDWIVQEGLKEGEQVVAEGTQKARDGMKVNPKPFQPAGGDAATSAPAHTDSKSEKG